jgi:hypothetical protein
MGNDDPPTVCHKLRDLACSCLGIRELFVDRSALSDVDQRVAADSDECASCHSNPFYFIS